MQVFNNIGTNFPTGGIFIVKGYLTNENRIFISMETLSGQILLEKAASISSEQSSIIIDASNLSQGLYLLKIKSKVTRELHKVFKIMISK